MCCLGDVEKITEKNNKKNVFIVTTIFMGASGRDLWTCIIIKASLTHMDHSGRNYSTTVTDTAIIVES